MSSDESQECILNCKDAYNFFELPKKALMRNVWLSKLGLEDDDFHPSQWVCQRHFSDKMFLTHTKLKSIAVPDKNLLNELSTDVSKIGVKKTSNAKLPTLTKFATNQPAKSTVVAKPQSSTPLANTNATNVVIKSSNPQHNANPIPTQNWINDSSNILVDYQLKVRGKHLCDVIEIPQYIVVFTVVKAKQSNVIQLNDINKTQQNKKTKSNRKIVSKILPKPSEYITIDDDIDDTPEILLQDLGPSPIAQPKSLAIVQTKLPSVILPKRPATVQQILPPIDKKKVPTNLSAKIIRPLPEPSNVFQTKTKPELEPEPEIDIVYYTTNESLPRRERAVQIDFPSTLKETAIQCDVQLDNDIVETAYKSDIYWVEPRFSMINKNSSLYECLACGEIISNYACKVRHAIEHEKTSSLCSQCGAVFGSRMKLKAHERNVHPNELDIRKLVRCPKRNCCKAFNSKKQLNNHIEEHISAKQHKCNKCMQSFDSGLKLICHQRALDKCLRSRGWTSRRWSKRI